MSEKLTYKFVKEQFAKESYKLLTVEYKNNHQKLDYICPNGHKHKISWGSWKNGNRCPSCYNKFKRGQSVKKTVSFIKSVFEKEGYILLSKNYGGCSSKLDYICPKGHEHSITWSMWREGYRCSYCAEYGRPTIEFVRSEFRRENYILLTEKYIDGRQKLKYICPNGHRHQITWLKWQSGRRCPHCARNAKLTIEFIRSEFEKEGYQLLTNQYINNNQKLYYICPKNHKHYIRWSSWQQGNRCFYCFGNVKPTIESIRSEFIKENYILLTKQYKNAKQKLDYICPNGHQHSINWCNWRAGKRCPYCVGKISKGEVEVRDFIKSFGLDVSANDRNQIFNLKTGNGFELDIFMPTLNKAVEYNGEYWHQDKNKDLFKQKLCKSKMIDLLTIWESEWLNENEKCKNKIKKFIFNKA